MKVEWSKEPCSSFDNKESDLIHDVLPSMVCHENFIIHEVFTN